MDNTYELHRTFPARLDITIRKGSIFQLLPFWLVRDVNGKVVPKDLMGWTAKMQIRLTPDTGVIATFSTENARILLPTSTDPVYPDTSVHVFGDSTKHWNIWIRVPATDSVNWAEGVYRYDLELEPPGNPGARFAFYEGVCCIDPEVTK